jgi:ElaB/YqjD/DUF883 family membrane-anchored ribosome-binding protein
MSAKKTETKAKEEDFIDNVKASLDDAEQLLRDAASSTGEKAAELRERAMVSLRRTREALYDTQDVLLDKGRRAARATDDYVHDNPWQAIGMAGFAGLLVGMLISRR